MAVDRPIFDQFRDVALRIPSKLAIDDGRWSLTYGELLARVEDLAQAVAEAGPPAGIVAIGTEAPACVPVAMLACLRTGRPFVVLDPADPFERRRRVLDGARPVLLISDAGRSLEFPSLATVRVRLEAAVGQDLDPRLEGARSRGPDDPAVIVYTSGSTGFPKGVANSQRAILQRVNQYARSCHISERDAFLPLCGLGTIAGLRETFAALLSGAALRLDRLDRVGLSGLREVIGRKRPTLIYAAPSLLRAVLSKAAPADFDSVRVLRVGGEEVRWSDVALARRRLSAGCLIQVGYSSTETTGAQWFVPADYPAAGDTVPIGYMLPGTEFAVLGEDGRPAPPGEVGTLVIRGSAVALGEWRSGALTPGSIASDPTDPSVRIYVTGDLVSVAADGLLCFAGRDDDQVKVMGLRLELAELEQRLRAATGVEDAAALKCPAGQLVAFAAVARASPELARELRAELRSSLPRGLQPARLHLLEKIPRLVSGKTDKHALLQHDAEAVACSTRQARSAKGDGNGAAVHPAVALAWSLFLPGSSEHDRPWDEEGGDSLALLGFVLELERLVDMRLPLDEFDPRMSRSDFTRVLSELKSGRSVYPAGAARTAFFFPGMINDVPATASFRAKLNDDLSFVTMAYAGLEKIEGVAPDLATIAGGLAAEISHLHPEGDLYLTGYSFGGAVAFETASQLAARGREIAFLGIIDTDLSLSTPPQWGRVRTPVIRLMAAAAVQPYSRRVLLWALRRFPLPHRRRAGLVRAIEGELRLRALQQWARTRKSVLPARGVLFVTQQLRPRAPPDLGWGALVRALEIVPFAGDHVSCLHLEPHAEANRESFSAAIRACPTQRTRTAVLDLPNVGRGPVAPLERVSGGPDSGTA